MAKKTPSADGRKEGEIFYDDQGNAFVARKNRFSPDEMLSLPLSKEDLEDLLAKREEEVAAANGLPEPPRATEWTFGEDGSVTETDLGPLYEKDDPSHLVMQGTPEQLASVLPKVADIDGIKNHLLNIAINWSRPEIAQVLLQHGACPNRGYGTAADRPLANAINSSEETVRLVELLLKAGARSDQNFGYDASQVITIEEVIEECAEEPELAEQLNGLVRKYDREGRV